MASLQKNVAGQNVTFALINATTGAALVGATVSVAVTKDNGAQAAGGGTVTGAGAGQYNYAPTQAETNATDVGFLFTATNAIAVNIDFHTDPGVLLSSGTGANQIGLDGAGNVAVSSNLKKNTAGRVTFIMTNATTHVRQTGLTVTSQRVLDGGALAATTNAVSEIGVTGIYTLVLTAADQNANELGYLMTATGADDRFIERVTQP
jgi:hypothetical protein